MATAIRLLSVRVSLQDRTTIEKLAEYRHYKEEITSSTVSSYIRWLVRQDLDRFLADVRERRPDVQVNLDRFLADVRERKPNV